MTPRRAAAALVGYRQRPLAARWHLTWQCLMHVVNDALSAGIIPLLPLVAADLGLSYAQVGALKAAYSGASSAFQVPAGIAAERVGEQMLLGLGTGWLGLGLVGMGLAGGFWALVGLGFVGGLGGNTQHPIATSVVSRIFEGPRRSSAIGTLNFAGDLGKILAPLAVGGLAVSQGWRAGFLALGIAAFLFSLVYLAVVPEPARPRAPAARPGARGGSWGIARPGMFAVLVLIGVLDSATRGAGLTFVPFVLAEKGFDPAAIAFFFTILFAAGAAGKFLCGPLGDRFGNVAAVIVTELLTAASLILLLRVPAELVLLALLPLGFALNGTSSVLYALVPSFVDVERRARGYGLYFTATLLASAAAPIAYGLLADATGLDAAFGVLAAATLAIAPLTLIVRAGLR